MKSRLTSHKIAFLSVMLALAVVLGYVESFIPSWIPGAKPGLANLVIVILMFTYPFYDALLVSLLRVFIVALLRGTIFQMPFYMSLAGALLSLAFMLIAYFFFKFLTIYGISLLGAYVHSLAQILVAYLFTESPGVFYYFPFVSLLSLAAGLLTALVADHLLKYSPIRKLKEEQNN